MTEWSDDTNEGDDIDSPRHTHTHTHRNSLHLLRDIPELSSFRFGSRSRPCHKSMAELELKSSVLREEGGGSLVYTHREKMGGGYIYIKIYKMVSHIKSQRQQRVCKRNNSRCCCWPAHPYRPPPRKLMSCPPGVPLVGCCWPRLHTLILTRLHTIK